MSERGINKKSGVGQQLGETSENVIAIGGRPESSGNGPSPRTIYPTQVKPIEIALQHKIRSVAFLVNGEDIVSTGDDGCIRRWRVEDGAEVGKPTYTSGTAWSLAVSRDGKWVVTGAANGRVEVWNAENLKLVSGFNGHDKLVRTVDVNSDGTRIATGSADETACVWSLSTPERLLGPLRHDGTVLTVKFSPDGLFLATTAWGCDVVRIHYNQGHYLGDFPVKLPPSGAQVIAWVSDSTQLLVLSRDGYINCLDVLTGMTSSRWPVHSSDSPACIALASDGAFVAASANSSVSFWDTTTHKQIGSIIRHSEPIAIMTISANQNLAIGGEMKVILCSLRDVPSSSYSDDTRQRMDNSALEESPRAKEENQNRKVAYLEETVQHLSSKLSESHHRVNSLNETVESLCRKIARLEQQFCIYELKDHCEALFAECHIADAAVSLLEIINLISKEVGARRLILDWLAKFKSKCISALEIIGDQTLSDGNHNEAIAAYSTALLLGPSTPEVILVKWTKTVLTRSSIDDALTATANFNVPSFLIYRTICDVLEEDGRTSEAVKCFQQLQCEVEGDIGNPDGQPQPELDQGLQRRHSDAVDPFHTVTNTLGKRMKSVDKAEWVTNFKARCLGTLEQRGSAAFGSGSYRDAIDHYTSALILDPLSTDLLIQRSRARAGAGSWIDSLEDADFVIQLDPTSPRGYERRHAALLRVCRYDEAIDAYDDMLLKLEQSPDPDTRELRNRYVSPSRTTAAIRSSVKRTLRGAPLVLINTDTGQLCDQQERINEFEADSRFKELVASMTTVLDDSRIAQTVQQYFRYATFSHTWEGAEPLFHEVLKASVHKLTESSTVLKLAMFCRKVKEAGLYWAWSDTCCINKMDGSVLQESLTSMFEWYHESALTIVHLKGVRSDSELGALVRCLWNTRAWTLQEFFASRVIRFYTEDWTPYLPHESAHNHKDSPAIMGEMAAASGVDAQVLLSLRPGSGSVRQKLCLAAARVATKQEDIAYSLFGIFDVSIPVTYGEGQQRALGRLLQEVLTRSGDVTVLAWTGRASEYNSCLPAEMSVYLEPASPYIPSPMEEGEMDRLVAELRTSPRYLNSAMMLYDRLVHLPSPRVVSRRLSLSCIIFPLKCPLASSSDSQGVYHAVSPALGNVEITTREDLSNLRNLMLVHPWFQYLFDPAIPSEDMFADNDASSPTADTTWLPPVPPHTLSPPSDKLARALRLLARLRQPFGGLLLVPLSHREYKRIASDHPIVVQVLKEVPPHYLAQKTRTLDIL